MRRPILGKRSLLLVGAAIAFVAPACSTATSNSTRPSGTSTLKVAVIVPSASNDLAFSQSMVDAVNSLKTRDDLQIAVSDNQFAESDAANVIRRYASQGYSLIIAHGSQYGAIVQRMAPQFPKVSFAWGTASSTFNLPNVFAYQANSNEGGYVQGYMGAMLSKSHVVGAIGPLPVGDAKRYIDGFKAGAKAADKAIDVHVAYTGSFSDVSLMTKEARGFLADHADVLTGSSQAVVGAVRVAKSHHTAWFGTQSNQASLAPGAVVSSQVYDWTKVLQQIITAIRGGTLGGAMYTITLANGGEKIVFNPMFRLPADVKSAGEKQISRVEDGSITVPR